MEKKMANHFVVLHTDCLQMFSLLEGRVVGKDGLIYCHTIKEGARFLEVEAYLGELAGHGSWIHLSIPYAYISYVLDAPDINQKQALGFRGGPDIDDVPPQ